MKRFGFGVVIAMVTLATTVGASNPRTTTTTPASITLNGPVSSLAATPALWPALGDTVTFSVTYAKQYDKFGPRIQVLCYQESTLVYAEAGPYSQGFLLGGASSNWLRDGGSAHCVADLYYWSYQGGQKFNWLASTSFDVVDPS